MNFNLVSSFSPTGDQPQAIEALTGGLKNGLRTQVLLGVTGSGKTFTMANVIARMQRPSLVISHNKTLAAQLYQEFRDFFPHNAVSYFVSYYDFYQPEAYLPQSDTYIEKVTEINEEIDKLRLAATTNLLTRKDTIIVASVSCIYNIGSPKEYGGFILELRVGVKISRESIISRLVDLQYNNNSFEFKRGSFRVTGSTIDIFPSYQDQALRIVINENTISDISSLDPLNGEIIEHLYTTAVYPAKHYMTNPKNYKNVFSQIRNDLHKRVKDLKQRGKNLEAYRLNQKVNYDLEMINELGYVNGIENYSRYFDGRKIGEPPFTLLDYFKEPYGNDWLLFIDESHMTVPQIRGMYQGDLSRKKTLIDFGFRLPAALDNRPLKFEEFMRRIPQTIYVSATPSDWEMTLAREAAQRVVLNPDLIGVKDPMMIQKPKGILPPRFARGQNDRLNGVVEQLIRPTGILDPKIIIRPSNGQITDLVIEILIRIQKGERVLVTTITKRIAEDLSAYLNEKKYLNDERLKNMKIQRYPIVHYLHSDIQTLERSDILDDLRNGKYDVLIGINLLREGLDLPEVSLVAILDADKEGFLRSSTSLIQTMGRAARHLQGTVIMYADTTTRSMQTAIDEINRRRNIQLNYNRQHRIVPKNIQKPIRSKLVDKKDIKDSIFSFLDTKKRIEYRRLLDIDTDQLTPGDIRKLIKKMEKEMKIAANELNFELAAELRDKIKELGTNLSN